jgi:hypothetical protein
MGLFRKEKGTKQLSKIMKEVQKRGDYDEIRDMSETLTIVSKITGNEQLSRMSYTSLSEKLGITKPKRSRHAHAPKFDSSKTVLNIVEDICEVGDTADITAIQFFCTTSSLDLSLASAKNKHGVNSK